MLKALPFGPAAILAIGGFSNTAFAQEIAPVEPDLTESIVQEDAPILLVAETVIVDLPEPVILENDGNLSDEELDSARGGATIVVGNQTLNAVNSGGVINGDFSAGSISLADNALTNFNGFGNLVINTGAQNNLQSGMNVTINFAN
jgi:hypothetical protein